MDLSNWDFKTEGTVSLKGEWEFYWNRLLSPVDFQQGTYPENNGYIQLPGTWNGFKVDNMPISGTGYATYHLIINLNPPDQNLALFFKDAASAARLWVNGREIAKTGKVGTSKETTIPRYRVDRYSFPADTSQLEIVLQVSNFSHRKGGAWEPIWLGSETNIQNRHNALITFDIIIFGALIAMAIHYLYFFFLRKKERYYLYFSLLSLISAVRILVIGNRLFQTYIPLFSWEIFYRIELWSVFLISPILIMFFCALYSDKRVQWILRLIQGIGAFFVIIPVFVPAVYSSYLVVPFEIYFLAVSVFAIYILIYALIRKNDGAGVLLFGFTFFLLTAFNDILVTNDFIYSIFLGSFGILVLILSLSYTLSFRFSKAFDAEEKLINMLIEKSGELEKKNIELFEADKIKDEIMANTSHELRTPINGIVGISKSLLNGVAGEISTEVRKNLTLIESSSIRLNHLINDLLDLSRLKEHDLTLNKQAVSFHGLSETVIDTTKTIVIDKPVEIQNRVPKSLTPVYGDADRLQQILYNLIGNAVKFTESGFVRVNAEQKEHEIWVMVSDSGIGIPAKEKKRVFEPFKQVDGTATRNYSGTGLGLSITKQLVELHGGQIWFDSTPGQGSTFYFSIPTYDSSSKVSEKTISTSLNQLQQVKRFWKPESPSAHTVTPKSPLSTNPWIVAIDDDPVNLKVVKNYFKLHGISNITALSSGQEALDLTIKGEKPDLILLDIMMPNMSGIEVCKTLRAHFTHSELPIIMLTAKNTMNDMVEGFNAGASDYITKPIVEEELISRTTIHLRLGQAYRILRENMSLRKQLTQRQETVQSLRLAHNRLTAMLDNVDSAIVAINENQEICFFNQQFATLSGYKTEAILGKPVNILFADNSKTEVMTNLKYWFSGELSKTTETYPATQFQNADHEVYKSEMIITSIELEQEKLALIIPRKQLTELRPSHQPLIKEVEKVFNILNRNRERMQILEDIFIQNSPEKVSDRSKISTDLEAVDQALARLEGSLSGTTEVDKHRRLAVDIITLCLACWSESTGSTKVELARQSGIWTVYTDNTGWERTQTLDKYLDYVSVPQKPRISRILETVEFVLSTCDSPSPQRKKLKEMSSKLRRPT